MMEISENESTEMSENETTGMSENKPTRMSQQNQEDGVEQVRSGLRDQVNEIAKMKRFPGMKSQV